MRRNRSGLGYTLRPCGPLQSLLEEPSTFGSVSVNRWTDPPYAPPSARTGYRIPASTRPFGADHNLLCDAICWHSLVSVKVVDEPDRMAALCDHITYGA